MGLWGCASGDPYMLPDDADAQSTAAGEAFTADGMHFRKPMPDRRDSKPWEFYYKHCAMNGNEAYFSKTSYDCTGPYY